MKDGPIVILGARGFIGNALMRAFQSANKEVIGVAHQRGDSILSPRDFLEKIVSGKANVHTLILATRKSTSTDPADDPLNILRIAEPFTQRLINLSTYAQFYRVSLNARHSEYIQSKRELSEYIKSTDYCKKSVDLALYTVIGEEDKPTSFFSSVLNDKMNDKPTYASSGEQLVSFTDIHDVVEGIFTLCSNWSYYQGNQFSFWRTPPEPLRTFVSELDKRFPNNRSSVYWGAKAHAGHELFSYFEELFPKQMDSNFPWTPFTKTVARMIDAVTGIKRK